MNGAALLGRQSRHPPSLTLVAVGEFDHIAAAMRESPLMSAFREMSLSGDFSALENNVKRQHFLPQLLLRKFSIYL